MIKLIVAVDNNFGIGYKNELLFRISEDLKHFKELTSGHFIVMGRKTYESLPNALPNRTNVVITRNPSFNPKSPTVVVANDIKKIISHHLTTGKQDKDLWVIGGAEIYKAFLPYADEVHLTHIHKEAENVDTYFPVSELNSSFDIIQSERIFSEKEDCKVTFTVYGKSSKVTI